MTRNDDIIKDAEERWASDNRQSDYINNLRAKLAAAEAAIDTYGDHRWKCATARALRDPNAPAPCPPCDCGWSDYCASRPRTYSAALVSTEPKP